MSLPGLMGMMAGMALSSGIPDPVLHTDDSYWYNNCLQVQFTGANGSTAFTDQSRQGHTATANGNAQIQGNKVDLDGAGDFVSFPDSWAWLPNRKMTWDLYGVEFRDTTNAQVLLSYYAGNINNQSWRISYEPGGAGLAFQASPDGITTNTVASYAGFVPTGEHDVGVSWDGTTVRLYLDGLMVGSGAYTTFIDPTSAQTLKLGCDSASGVDRQFFNGKIAAFRIARGVARMTGSTYARFDLPLPTVSATTVDPYWGDVLLLLTGDASGNIYDESPWDWPVTNVNTVTVSTSVQPISGVNSLVFNGTSQHVEVKDNTFLELLGSDFAVETWARHNTNTTAQYYITKWQTASGRSWAFGYRGDLTPDVLGFSKTSSGSSGGTFNSVDWTPTVNTFYHVAHCRSGSNYRFFANGTQVGATDTTAVTLSDTSTVIRVGAIHSSGVTLWMDGYLSEVRITKAARYTTGFTAPTAAFPRG